MTSDTRSFISHLDRSALPNVAGRIFSPACDRALERLAELDWMNRRPGSDMHEEAYRIAAGFPVLLAQLIEGDRLVRELPGDERLRRRRRLGVFRWIDGPELGFSMFRPPQRSTISAPEPREFFLVDELEVVVIPGRLENHHWRPIKDELRFDELRALTMMKAGTLYRLTSKGDVPGQIVRELGKTGAQSSELRFSTIEVMQWGRVLRNLLPR
jgi:hypothetical protein